MSEVNKNLLRMRPEVNIEFRIYREWFEANILNISVLFKIFVDILSIPASYRGGATLDSNENKRTTQKKHTGSARTPGMVNGVYESETNILDLTL